MMKTFQRLKENVHGLKYVAMKTPTKIVKIFVGHAHAKKEMNGSNQKQIIYEATLFLK
jgi:hypothetical protein